MKEYILCAANHYNDGDHHDNQPVNINKGFVICGRRHKNCDATFRAIAGHTFNNVVNCPPKNMTQGFVTNNNVFVNRQQAYTIAYAANQIIGPNKGYPTNEIGLTSEDLY
jgi:hypothetical protein